MFIFVLLLGFLSSTIPTFFGSEGFSGKNLGWAAASLVGNAIMALVFVYFFMPVATGPLGGFLNLWPVIMINGIMGMVFASSDSSDTHTAGAIGSGLVLLVMAVVVTFNLLGGWVGRDKEKFAYANIETKPISEMPWDNNAPTPIVTEGNAKARFSGNIPNTTPDGRAVVGRYVLGDVVRQEVGGHNLWLGMLDYKSSWQGAFDETILVVPGYMRLDAEDEKSVPEFVPYEIRFFSGAYFDRDTKRLLYNAGYQDYIQIDPTIEISDEDGKLYETIGLGKYNFSVGFNRIDKIAIIDVTTGAIVNVCNVGECPSWVDRQIDDSVASISVAWFGKFIKDDWWNPLGRDTFQADDEPVFVYSQDSGKEFQYLMTSTAMSENTSTGVLYYKTDMRQGTYYQVQGEPFPIGNDVLTIIQDHPEIKVSGFVVDQILLRNISGHPSWLATLSSTTAYGTKYQYTAYVLASTSVTSNDVQFDARPEIALQKYEAWLKQYFEKERGTILGTVADIGTYQKDGNSIFTMIVRDGNGQVISAVDPVSGQTAPIIFLVEVTPETREIAMTQSGDEVNFEYFGSTWNEYIVTRLENNDRPSLLDSIGAAFKALFGK